MQVKAEKIADSEDVGGGSAGQAPRQPALQPSGSSAQALVQARQRQADARDVARYPSGGHPPFPPGAGQLNMLLSCGVFCTARSFMPWSLHG